MYIPLTPIPGTFLFVLIGLCVEDRINNIFRLPIGNKTSGIKIFSFHGKEEIQIDGMNLEPGEDFARLYLESYNESHIVSILVYLADEIQKNLILRNNFDASVGLLEKLKTFESVPAFFGVQIPEESKDVFQELGFTLVQDHTKNFAFISTGEVLRRF